LLSDLCWRNDGTRTFWPGKLIPESSEEGTEQGEVRNMRYKNDPLVVRYVLYIRIRFTIFEKVMRARVCVYCI